MPLKINDGYSIRKILSIVRDAIEYISDNQSSVWGTPELNICHHLACELKKKFSDFDIDVELIKDDRRRPDIVIHKRGNNENNLVVFQVKINPTSTDIKEDLFKIEDTFFRAPYSYKYGLFISVGKLPNPLPEFDSSKIRFIQIYGWKVAKSTSTDYKF